MVDSNHTCYRRLGLVIGCLLLAVLPVLALPGMLKAADITVTTTSINETPDSECTLPEAIKAANTNAAYNGCPAGELGNDTVILQDNQTYVVTAGSNQDGFVKFNGLPGITDELTIRGNNAIIQRSSASQFRFIFTDAPLTLENVTLRGGDSDSFGGAIFAKHPVTLTGASFINNRSIGGGAIWAQGAGVYMTGSLFQGNQTTQSGGAFSADKNVTVINSEFLTNTSEFSGGAFRVDADAFVTGSTFRNNHAIDGSGGAIRAKNAVTLTNTSFISNTGDTGGAVSNGEFSRITGGTFMYNRATGGAGGGIYSTGVLGASLIDGTTFISNTSVLEGGGAAINSALTVQNAHFERNVVQGLRYGGGLNAGLALTMTGSTFLTNTAGTDGGGVNAWHATISDSEFRGNVAGDKGGGVATSGNTVIVNSNFISNTALYMNVSSGGGGLAVSGPATVTGSEFRENRSENNGGAISSRDVFSATTVTLADNRAGAYGGGIYADRPATIHDARLERNHAGDWGGALYASEALTLTMSDFYTNTSDSIGGAIALGSITVMTGVQVVGNQAQGRGGGIVATDPFTLTQALIQGNHSEDQGGGIAVDDWINLNRAIFADNTADRGGGGIYVRAPGTANRIVNGLFYDNHSDYEGNHLMLLSEIPGVGTGSVDVIHATLATSKVFTGSGVYIGGSGSGAVNITNSILASNEIGVKVGGTIAFSEDSNLFNNGTNLVPTLPLGPNSLTGDPGFIDRVAGDFHLLPTSAAIDKAADAGVSDDFEGDARPQIAGFDMGADEALPCTPLTSVTISGPSTGVTGIIYEFSAVIEPGSATIPIEYTWSPAPNSRQGSSQVTYSWPQAGDKDITVQASNCFGTAAAAGNRKVTVTEEEESPALYLPSVLKQ